jgi:pyruvate-ferredoxin/flavodoxin oxidoreductase
MRKMADGFVAVRRAVKVLDGTYDADRDEADLSSLDWKKFSDEEFLLCPPILAMGGDGAMQDAGFQSLSRVLASGRPIRVIVLDTQGHSDSGGQASTGSFTGQAAAASTIGSALRGRTEIRKELGLLAMAHRGVFVHQSSQASPAHLMAGVLKGLKRRRPALFNVYTPCPMEHGLADHGSQQAARLALESRAFPFFTCDPDAGASLAASMSLDGNPSVHTDWPMYSLRHLDDTGAEKSLDVPLTIADWAATEDRFKGHFAEEPADQGDEAVPFDQLVRMSGAEREGKTAFIHAVGPDRRLRRLRVAPEIVALADDRLRFWSQLRQLAGLEVSEAARHTVSGALEAEFEVKLAALRAEYDARIAELKREYPKQIARRLAEGLIKHGGGGALSDLLATLPAAGPSSGGKAGSAPKAAAPPSASAPVVSTAPPAAPTEAPPAQAVEAAPAKATAEAGGDEPLVLEAYIDSARCTTCNECTNLNKRMFAYNAAKQAEIKDVSAGTFQQLVLAAERCPVAIIHPGTPLNPKEKDLEKWVKRAEKFN